MVKEVELSIEFEILQFMFGLVGASILIFIFLNSYVNSRLSKYINVDNFTLAEKISMLIDMQLRNIK